MKILYTIKDIYIFIDKYGDWGLGPIPNPQSPIPNPPSPIPSILSQIIKIEINFNSKL